MTTPIRPPRHFGLLLVAIWESLKGLVFVLVAFGLLRLLGKDMQVVVKEWAHVLRLNLQGHLVARVSGWAGLINPHEIKQVCVMLGFLGALHLTQGVGLFLEKRWAEYLTVVGTAVFIPWEVYHLFAHPTLLRAAVLVANVALVVYLALLLRRERKTAPPVPPPPTAV